MKNIMANIITADNYVAIIVVTFILVVALFAAAKLMKKRNIIAGIVAVCFMAMAAGLCLSSIAISVPYMQADIDNYSADYTDSLIGDYGIDSSMVNLSFPQQ